MTISPEDLKELKNKQKVWEGRSLSDEELSYLFPDNGKVKDPCVHCGVSTAFGSGNFVNRIPADRYLEDGTYINGHMCPTCQSPPLCFECDEQPAEYLDFRCEKCNEEIEQE